MCWLHTITYDFLSLVRHFVCFENNNRHGDHVMVWWRRPLFSLLPKLAYSRTVQWLHEHAHASHVTVVTRTDGEVESISSRLGRVSDSFIEFGRGKNLFFVGIFGVTILGGVTISFVWGLGVLDLFSVVRGVISSDDVDVSGCWIAFGFAICLTSVEFLPGSCHLLFQKSNLRLEFTFWFL